MSAQIHSIGDLLQRLGVPPDRVRFRPPPGTATLADVERIYDSERRLCELIDGVLVEKAMGIRESMLGGYLLMLVLQFVRARNLGMVTGEAGALELMAELVRIPDVAFISWDRVAGRRWPEAAIPRLAPNLAIEVLSKGNCPAEMAAKRDDYFGAGVEVVWEVDPARRTVDVYTSPTDRVTLGVGAVLDGGTVLPGFSLSLADLFGELDSHG